MPGTPITDDRYPPPADTPVVAWHRAARAVCEITVGVSDLADILQGHPELRGYDFADLQAAHRSLGRILDFVKQRVAR